MYRLTDVIEACFNCTKRRIVCDLTPPKCKKCEKKGLDCPGYGVRYRFANGQTVSPSELGSSEGSSAATTISTGHQSSLKWVNGSKRARKRRDVEVGVALMSNEQSLAATGTPRGQVNTDILQAQEDVDNQGIDGVNAQTSSSVGPVSVLQKERQEFDLILANKIDSSVPPDTGALIETMREGWLPATSAFSAGLLNLPPLLSNRDPKIRLLFDHCMSSYVCWPIGRT